MRRYLKEILKLAAVVACVLLLGFFLWGPQRKPKLAALRMTAGDASGLRHKMAMELANDAARMGITIHLKPTAGSEAALEGLKNGEFDLALVQGGLTSGNETNIRQMTPLHVEPLHLLVKPDLFSKIRSSGLSGLAGCDVNLGSIGSGTHVLAKEVLKFAGLRVAESGVNGYHAETLGYRELMELAADNANSDKLPDAIFTVSSLPSPLADFMIETCDYRLVSMPFGEAMLIESFLQLGESPTPNSIDKRHLHEARIPAFTYSVNRSEPPEPLDTIGTRLLMVASERVPNEVVQLLLDAVYNSSFALAERPPLEPSLLDLPPEFPLHRGTIDYRQRNKPLIAGDAIDYWEKVLAISATMITGLFFLVQWYRSWSQRKREASFASYMNRVIAIENASMKTEFSAQLDLAQLIQLQKELADLKSEAVGKFANGELDGEGLINGFLALVNDARTQLTRLILHQRDNIEEQATQQHLDADEIWASQTKGSAKKSTPSA